MPLPEPVLQLQDLYFGWPGGSDRWHIPELSIKRGEHCFLHGPSGCGKSTLLALLAGMIKPQAGSVTMLGSQVSSFAGRRRDRFRADHMGIIFQQFNLVPYLNALENVLLTCRFSRLRREKLALPLHAAGCDALRALGLPENRWRAPVGALSVGQQQRVAAARALLGGPEIILADEPTSALDAHNRDRFVEVLIQQARDHQSTVLFVSHDRDLSGHFSHSLEIGQWREAGV